MNFNRKFILGAFLFGMIISTCSTTVKAANFTKPISTQALKDMIVNGWLEKSPIYPIEARGAIEEYMNSYSGACANALKLAHRVRNQLADPNLSEDQRQELNETLQLAEADLTEYECLNFDAFITKLLEKYKIYPVLTESVEITDASSTYIENCERYAKSYAKECRLGDLYFVHYEFYHCPGVEGTVFTEEIYLRISYCDGEETKHPYLGKSGYLKLP